jgi:serine/threonine protein kinase
MPAPTTVDDFLDLVHKSGLVDPVQVAALIDKLRAAEAFPSEPKKLAKLLIKEGLLTYFYAEQFLRGIWRGFTIGKYQILERIGSGGMGIVYLGEHKLMGHRVAIKVLPVALAEHRWFLEHFYEEARAAAALNHVNIVRAHDIDREGNLHFLVMEYVDGSSLQHIVSKYGPMDVTRAAHCIRQAALGLQHVHEAGMVHRDVKPANLLLDRQGVLKILDLGLVRIFHDTPKEPLPGKVKERLMVGTDDYLAPEQIVNSEEVDARADVYGLGATFYFLLTAKPPFEDDSLAYQKLLKHLAQRPKPVQELRSDLPPGLAAVVEKMMAKNPWERYQTPLAVVEALAPWTQAPAPLPPAHEMPQLSPAAHRPRGFKSYPTPAMASVSGDNSAVLHSRTDGSTASGFFSAPGQTQPGLSSIGPLSGKPLSAVPAAARPSGAPTPPRPLSRDDSNGQDKPGPA